MAAAAALRQRGGKCGGGAVVVGLAAAVASLAAAMAAWGQRNGGAAATTALPLPPLCHRRCCRPVALRPRSSLPLSCRRRRRRRLCADAAALALTTLYSCEGVCAFLWAAGVWFGNKMRHEGQGVGHVSTNFVSFLPKKKIPPAGKG